MAEAGSAAKGVPQEAAERIEDEAREQIVTPWEVEAAEGKGIDYDKLVRDFGRRSARARARGVLGHLPPRAGRD
jgi:hypothetical protein